MDDLLANAVEVCAQFYENLCGNTFALTDETQQDVLGADVVVAQLQRFAETQLQDLLCTRSKRNVPGGSLLALPDDFLHLFAHSLKGNIQRFESFRGDTFALVDETQQDVLGANVVVVEHLGFFLCQDDDSTRPVGKPLKHVCHSLFRGIGETSHHYSCYESNWQILAMGRCSPPA